MSEKDRERAKRVIAEIVRQSPGDELIGKTRLFNAFYLAHLYYATECKDYLTEWPIVKMPNGPGIDRFSSLIAELIQEGAIETGTTRVGPYQATVYRAIGWGLEVHLPQAAVSAIRKSIEFVNGKTGAQLSDITHEFSRSWNEAEQGEEQSIYLDVLSEEDYQAEQLRASRIKDELAAAWNE